MNPKQTTLEDSGSYTFMWGITDRAPIWKDADLLLPEGYFWLYSWLLAELARRATTRRFVRGVGRPICLSLPLSLSLSLSLSLLFLFFLTLSMSLSLSLSDALAVSL